MKLRIGDREYDMARVGQAHLNDLIALKRETGLSPEDIQTMLEGLDQAAKKDPKKAIEDDSALLTMGIIVWLARRRAGERLSLEDACDFPVTDLVIIVEPGDEPPSPARPTRARAASARAGASRQNGRARKTTSRKPSSRG